LPFYSLFSTAAKSQHPRPQRAAFSFLEEKPMHLSPRGLSLLKKSEGFRDRVYADVAGFPTIGFGHRLSADEAYPIGISLLQGEALLSQDLAIAEAAVDRLVKVTVTQGQFDALVDFVFNLGAGRLASSTLLRYLNTGKSDAAAWELLAWDHAGSREIASLKARREAEFQLWNPHSAAA
jgi:lysozyme